MAHLRSRLTSASRSQAPPMGVGTAWLLSLTSSTDHTLLHSSTSTCTGQTTQWLLKKLMLKAPLPNGSEDQLDTQLTAVQEHRQANLLARSQCRSIATLARLTQPMTCSSPLPTAARITLLLAGSSCWISPTGADQMSALSLRAKRPLSWCLASPSRSTKTTAKTMVARPMEVTAPS